MTSRYSSIEWPWPAIGRSLPTRFRQPAAVAVDEPEHRRRQDDEQERGDRGARVGADLRRAPDLGREGVEADRPQQDRRGQLLHRGQEDERRPRERAGAGERDGDEPGGREGAATEPSRRFLHSWADAREPGVEAREREREEPDGVGEDEQPERL